MNVLRLTSVLCPCLLAFVLRAQHIIELKAGTLSVPGLHERIDSVVLVFDALDPIGIVRKGDQPVPAYLDGPVDRVLHKFLSGGGPAESGSSLVIKVNVLRLREQTVKGGGRASCALHLEVLRREGPGTWVHLYTHGTNAVWHGAGVTGAHDRTLANAFNECMVGYVAARDGQKLGTAVIDAVGLRELPEETLPFSALAPVPRRGLYHTFMDVLLDRPDTLTPFVLERRDPVELPRCMRMKGDSVNELRKALWGCSDGERRYVNVDGYFLELSRDTVLRTRVRYTDWDPEMAIAGTVMFGALGGALGAAASLEERSVPVRVDPRTGRLVSDPDRWSEVPIPADRSLRAEVLFVHSKYGAQEKPICLQAPKGERSICMEKGQHHTMFLQPRRERIIIQARVGNVVPVEVAVNANDLAKQVFLLKADKSGDIKASRLNWEMSQAVLRDLDEADAVQ